MKKFFNEFKEFALKSNVMAMAVGVIIGGALQRVVSSLVENILSPLIEPFPGGTFDGLSVTLFRKTIHYGAFISSVVYFIIIAFVVFLMIKGMNKLLTMRKAEDIPPRKCPFCMSQLHEEATRCPSCTSEVPCDAPPESETPVEAN